MIGRTDGKSDRETEGRRGGWKYRTGKMCFPFRALLHRTEGLITTLFFDWLFIFALITRSSLTVLNISPTSRQIIIICDAVFETGVIVNKSELNKNIINSY